MTSPANGTFLVLQMQFPVHCVEVVMCKGDGQKPTSFCLPFFKSSAYSNFMECSPCRLTSAVCDSKNVV